MNRGRPIQNHYTNYEEDENPVSFEVIRRYKPDTSGETIMYDRSDEGTLPAAAPLEGSVGGNKEECERFLEIILENVGEDDGSKKPLIIALIGSPGVGKSSFVCSLAAAISQDRWREYAYTGSYGVDLEPVTVFVETYEKCAMERIERNAAKFADNLLPTIVDIAGVENEENDLWKELLEIVFFGRLPRGEALYTAYKYGEEHGIQGLRAKYSKNDEILKVERIIFLASATEEIPENLIKCVRAAARPGGDSDSKRAIPLFGVMTKTDQVTTPIKRGEVSADVFEKREERFIQLLGLSGVTTRYLAMCNYCDATVGKKRLSTTVPEIDAPLLQFMTQVCDPAYVTINRQFTYTSKGKDWTPPNHSLRKRRPNENEQNTENEKTEHNSQVVKKIDFSVILSFIKALVFIALVFMMFKCVA